MNLSRIEPPSNRNFGLFFTAVCAAIGVYFLNEASNTIAYAFFIFAVVLLATTICKPDLLLPLNKLWIRFGLLLGMIFNPIKRNWFLSKKSTRINYFCTAQKIN